MNMLKRSAPDGTTIGVVISLAQTIDLIQNKTASFDIGKDFTPITAIANNPAGLVVNSQIAATSLTAFRLVRGDRAKYPMPAPASAPRIISTARFSIRSPASRC